MSFENRISITDHSEHKKMDQAAIEVLVSVSEKIKLAVSVGANDLGKCP